MASPSTQASVYDAVSSPARRALLAHLALGEARVTQLAERFDMSISAMSQHLTVLKGAGLVKARSVGRQRLYRLEAKPLKEISDWVASYEKFWSDKLAALGEFLEEDE
jgi:DNA-binding transcriptional ArsR family regulator